MKNKGNTFLKKIIPIFLVAVISCMVINNAVFMHSHILADGSVVVHAHPYNKTNDSQPFKSHKHSKVAIVLYQQLHHFLAVFFAAFLIIMTISRFLFNQTCFLSIPKHFVGLKQGRAPPVI